MRRKVTLKQIAKELDVSISTVSKSLRNSPEISEDTREKVKAWLESILWDWYFELWSDDEKREKQNNDKKRNVTPSAIHGGLPAVFKAFF